MSVQAIVRVRPHALKERYRFFLFFFNNHTYLGGCSSICPPVPLTLPEAPSNTSCQSAALPRTRSWEHWVVEGAGAAGSGSQRLTERLSWVLVQARGLILTPLSRSCLNLDWLCDVSPLSAENRSQESRMNCTLVSHIPNALNSGFKPEGELYLAAFRWQAETCSVNYQTCRISSFTRMSSLGANYNFLKNSLQLVSTSCTTKAN